MVPTFANLALFTLGSFSLPAEQIMLRSLFIFSSCSLCGRIGKNKSRNAKGQTPSISILLTYSQFLNLTSHALIKRRKIGNKQHVTCFATLLLDREQSLFFFRFSKGSARARERWAARPRDARNEGGSHLMFLVTRVVICVSRAFFLTDQEKRETARSLHICKISCKAMMRVLPPA